MDQKIVCSFSLQLWSETFLILRRIQQDITITVHIIITVHITITVYRSSCSVPDIFVSF